MSYTKELNKDSLVINSIIDPNFRKDKFEEPYLKIVNDDRNAPGMGFLANKEDAVKLATDIFIWAYGQDDEIYQEQIDKVLEVAGRMYLGLPTHRWERRMVVAWMQKNP